MEKKPQIDLLGLQTHRLKFRVLENSDFSTLLEYFEDEEAMKYMFPPDDIKSWAQSWIDRQRARFEENGSGLHAVHLRSDNTFIGMVGLIWQNVGGSTELEVGYHIFPKYWRQGYASEAAIACKEYALKHELAPRITSIIFPENRGSIAVARKNGMRFWKATIFKGIPVHIYVA